MEQQPSEQKLFRIDAMLNKYRAAYTDSKRTKCDDCRENFTFIDEKCFDKKHLMSHTKFTSSRKAREFFNCSKCNSDYQLKQKAERVEDVKTKRFTRSFNSDSETFLEQYETPTGTLSFPVKVYKERVYTQDFSPKAFRESKRQQP